MTRGIRRCLFGAVAVAALGALAGCSGHYLFAEREPWRHEAELECINSGVVKEGPGKVRISPIEGPGVCGADFPLKVSSLGGDSAPLGYDDELRPPGVVPNAAGPAPSRWPIAQPRPAASAVTQGDLPPPGTAPGSRLLSDQSLSLDSSGARERAGAMPQPYDFRKPYGVSGSPSGRVGATSAPPTPDAGSPYDFSPEPYDRRQVIGILKSAPRSVPSPPPMLGRAPTPPVTASIGPVAVSPAATLACPLVSVLDQWIDDAVQPAAVKWFGVPVVEIKQISAYSCRGMNGDPNATISEHAFGNALDIAAFTLADGRKIDVEHGWHGAPEEQAFLHEVQATACDQFTTVLAPGSNAFHYNHIHVDLMRRRNDRHACNPRPIPGDEMAARSGAHVAARRSEPLVTGSVGQHRAPAPPQRLRSNSYAARKSDLPDATPGADGED
jgi:Extensin-like protein C-terminus